MSHWIAVPVAVTGLTTLGYLVSRILLFGLVKPEDVETSISQIETEKLSSLPSRKPAARTLPARPNRVARK